MNVRGIIFDLDGVIVSTDECHYKAWKRIADNAQIYFDAEINKRLRGVSRIDSLKIILENANRSYSQVEKEQLAETKNGYYLEYIKELTPEDILPGVLDFISEARKYNIKIAIGSSSRNAIPILDKIGLSKSFDAIADGNDIKNSKPDPEVFLLAAKKISVSPQECLVIEDADAGVEAALLAGMKVLAVGDASRNHKADFSAQHLSSEVFELVRGAC